MRAALRAGSRRLRRGATSPRAFGIRPAPGAHPRVPPMTDTAALLRLLQLASPALPVGAYSYSQGLECAVANGVVFDERSAARWIDDVLTLVVAGYEGPMLLRMLDAGERHAVAELHALNASLLAGRETAELRAETVQMGRSL